MTAKLDPNRKQPAQVIKMVQRQLDQSPLGELRDAHIAFINYFVQDIIKLHKWRLDIDYRARPRTITIVPQDADGRAIYASFKHERVMLERIHGFLNLPDYQVKFYKRES